jgi:hypothetical protein
MNWLSNKLISFLSHSQTIKVLEFIVNKLSTLKTLLKDQSSPETDSMKQSSEYQITTSINLLSTIIKKLEKAELAFLSAEIPKVLLNFLPYPKIQLQAIWCIESLVKKSPSIVLNLISQMITLSTISYAEIEGLRTQYFSREALNENINSLLGNCSCLATLIKCLPACDRGIPVEETEIAFNTIKNMVSGGEYQGDIMDEEKMFAAEASDQEIDNAIRQAA